MNRTLEIFRQIAPIRRCSHHTQEMAKYIREFATALGFEAWQDQAGNILCRKNPAKLALQAHYDMVCLEEPTSVTLLEENGWLKAVNSTLGADNGIGVAAMMAMMEEFDGVEYLFTADEEVGMLGARKLDLPLRAQKLLNLDTEEAGLLYLGCAGGVEIEGRLRASLAPVPPGWTVVEVELSGLPGGHSGVDIDKPIPNAIQEMAKVLYALEAKIVSFKGGEKINAIPSSARASIAVAADKLSQIPTSWHKHMSEADEVIADSRRLLGFLASFAHGVRAWNHTFNLPEASISLSLVHLGAQECRIELYARAMDVASQRKIADETAIALGSLGFAVIQGGWYDPWKPELSEFASEVLALMRSYYPDAKVAAIHAGLECGLLKERFPSLSIASLGPTIERAHSREERLKIASVGPFEEIVRGVCRRYCD
ncbi:MAG: M20/M25/M40 family metallo-hydrolase [Campylobacterales bacterium]